MLEGGEQKHNCASTCEALKKTRQDTSRLSRSQILVGLFGLFPWCPRCPSLELQESNGVRLQSSIVRNRCTSGHCGWQVAPWH